MFKSQICIVTTVVIFCAYNSILYLYQVALKRKINAVLKDSKHNFKSGEKETFLTLIHFLFRTTLNVTLKNTEDICTTK